MEINRLYNLCKKENIDVNNYKMKKRKAKIIEDVSTSILLDYSKIHSETEEKCLLAEELRSLLLRFLLHIQFITNRH